MVPELPTGEISFEESALTILYNQLSKGSIVKARLKVLFFGGISLHSGESLCLMRNDINGRMV